MSFTIPPHLAATIANVQRSLLMSARIRLMAFHLRQLLLELGRRLPASDGGAR